jgi:methyltransferase-like protein
MSMTLTEQLSNSYNETPYHSHPFPQTTPEHLMAVAALFGVKGVAVEHARILELGCASGGNLIPIAARFPHAQIVGVDLSSRHIEEGQATITRLGLANISMQHGDLASITKSFGQFDYIISHGVYSWVPTEVQTSMLRICGENLSLNGLAYISYNTYPGWKYREVIRDAMMFRSSERDTPQERLSYARGMIDFLHEKSLPDSLTKKNIEEILPTLRNAQDYYLLHDFLELCNAPCYFKDFVERSKKNKLAYLAESQPSSMFVSNFPPEIADPLLREADGSQVMLEQHLDFLTGRSFRQTILIPENRSTEVNYRLDHAQLQNMHFAGTFIPVAIMAGVSEPSVFLTISGLEIQVLHPLAIITAKILNEYYPSTLQAHDLALEVSKRVPHANLADCLSIVLQFLENMIIKGAIRFRCSAVLLATQISALPLIDPAACQTYLNDSWITNAWHENIQLNIIEQSILRLLDGLHDLASLRAHLHQEVANGRITFSKQDVLVTDPTELATSIDEHLQANLISLQRKGLLAR